MLFKHLNKNYPGNFYLIVNSHLYNQLNNVFPDFNPENILIADSDKTAAENNPYIANSKNPSALSSPDPLHYSDHSPDAGVIDINTSLPRKYYWYYKNFFRQKKLFRKIEKLRIENNIRVFYGVFGGVLPLVFYTMDKTKRASVIFGNMDSWFSDVHPDMKKLWYRKFYSFNYALENADIVDFLSPYILEGVKKLNVNLKNDSCFVSPCSFTDYSNCELKDKSVFEAAFASRLEPDKNPMMYLEAARIICNKFPGVKFHIMGEGSLVNEVSGFIRQNSLGNSVSFSFHKNPAHVFSGTSVFVSLQTGTNYPSQSVLEAMACGNMIVASDTGDTNLFINSSNGMLIEPGTGKLAAALEYAILNRDETLRKGRNAALFAARNHTIEKFSEYFLGLLNKAYLKNFKA